MMVEKNIMLIVFIIYIIVLTGILLFFYIIGGKRKWSGTKIGNYQIVFVILWAIIVLYFIDSNMFDVIDAFKKL